MLLEDWQARSKAAGTKQTRPDIHSVCGAEHRTQVTEYRVQSTEYIVIGYRYCINRSGPGPEWAGGTAGMNKAFRCLRRHRKAPYLLWHYDDLSQADGRTNDKKSNQHTYVLCTKYACAGLSRHDIVCYGMYATAYSM